MSFKYTFTQELQQLGKIEVEWDLVKYYYKNEHDPRIEKDVNEAEVAHYTFAKKYKSGSYLKTNTSLRNALTAFESLIANASGRRALHYFSYRHTLNTKDAVAEKRLNLLEDRLTKAGNEILFFELMIGALPRVRQREILRDITLSHFHYFLQCIFEEARHTRSEKEEKILSLTSQTASSMWAQATEKIVSSRTILHEGKRIAIPEGLELINTLKPEKKQKLWDSITTELEQISEVVENELTAIALHKKTIDELRGFTKPYSATVLHYENNERSIEALIQAVSKKGFALSRRFYTAKARYHGLDVIPYVRKYDPVGVPLTFTFEEAVDICRDVFCSVHHDYGDFFDSMLTGGNIDVFPKIGKRGGAFMSSDVELPTFVFLNHTNDLSSLTTLAHEMGHALHSMRSKTQSPLYERYSTTTAETASTLFENILFDNLIRSATDVQKVSLLHERIMRTISSVCRQIAFFNFELELHNRVRVEGALTRTELSTMMQKHLTSYLGPSVEVTERDGYSYVYIGHFRYGFYVYTYAYGELMSMRMAEELKKDPSYVGHIDTFLSMGGSDSVDTIFKAIGITTSDPEVFNSSLKRLEKDVRAFEKLVIKK